MRGSQPHPLMPVVMNLYFVVSACRIHRRLSSRARDLEHGKRAARPAAWKGPIEASRVLGRERNGVRPTVFGGVRCPGSLRDGEDRRLAEQEREGHLMCRGAVRPGNL